jgi:Pretoxin HINT domain
LFVFKGLLAQATEGGNVIMKDPQSVTPIRKQLAKIVENSLVRNDNRLVQYRGLLEPEPACFVAGTLAHTKEGLKPIEQIKMGDYVLSKPDSGVGEQAYKRVTKTLVREAQDVWLVQYVSYDTNGEAIIRALVVTGNHPFWENRDQKWTPVSDLQAYACFVGLNNDDVYFFRALKILETDIPDVGCAIADNNGCEGPTVDLRNGKVYVNQPHEDGGVDFGNWIKRPVYNLEVEVFHTYYVGEDGIWVHNACPQI